MSANTPPLDRDSRWYSDMLSSKSDHEKAVAQIKVLEAQIKVAKAKVEVEKDKIRDAWSARMDACVSYSVAECFAIATKLEVTLPRELRDLVYSHCVLDLYIDLRYKLPTVPLSWEEVHPILLPEFVGLVVAQEAAQVYFEKYLTFYTLQPAHIASSLDKVLTFDLFDSATIPISHLRSIRFCIKSDSWGPNPWSTISAPQRERDERDTSFLSSLLPLVLKTKAKVIMELSSDVWDPAQILTKLNSTFEKLKESGTSLVILYNQRDLTDILDLPRNEREVQWWERTCKIDDEDYRIPSRPVDDSEEEL